MADEDYNEDGGNQEEEDEEEVEALTEDDAAQADDDDDAPTEDEDDQDQVCALRGAQANINTHGFDPTESMSIEHRTTMSPAPSARWQRVRRSGCA